MKGSLFLVSTPIGNYEDITLRALKILRDVDFIICEEFKQARRLLSHFKIEKELVALNEHTEKEVSHDLLLRLSDGNSAALISDAGTPLFSDPGHILVDLCISYQINIIPIPGANSLLPALISSGLNIDNFYYYGWISPKKEIRKKELFKLKHLKELIILMETPYRLIKILDEVKVTFGPKMNIVLAYKLTMKEEMVLRGSVNEILIKANKMNLKGEFILLIDNR